MSNQEALDLSEYIHQNTQSVRIAVGQGDGFLVVYVFDDESERTVRSLIESSGRRFAKQAVKVIHARDVHPSGL